jgi:murein DD-endopeptidase MepM/ murein hydrolase activator NlpD
LTVAQYKKLENQFAQSVGLWLRRTWVRIFEAFLLGMRKGKQRFTVMIIPHTENRIFNFQISFFSLIFFTCLIGVILAGFSLLVTHFQPMNDRLQQVSLNLRDSETSIQNLRDEVSALRKAEKGFKVSLQTVRKSMANPDPFMATGATEVASLFPATESHGQGNLKELADLKNTASLMDTSTETLDEVGKVLKTYKELLADTPTLWPLKGVHGIITTRFGWTIHPFTHMGYLHLGVDIAWAMGTPVQAAANGIVIQTGYNDDLGNFVAIQHKYGFMTRYLHMMRVVTRKGSHVNRGDTIGYVGTTGLSTGPHLHYEVHLGGNYVDPMNFLSIPPDLDATKSLGIAAGD